MFAPVSAAMGLCLLPQCWGKRAQGLNISFQCEESLLATFFVFQKTFNRSRVCMFFAALAVTAIVGCGGGSSGPAVSAVKGVVTLDGSPVADALVAFTPNDPSGISAVGKTGADGSFTLSATGAKPGAGTAPGSYVVTVEKKVFPKPPNITEDDPRYGTPEQEKLEREAAEAEPEYVVPQAYGDQKTSGLTASVESGGGEFTFALESSFEGK